MGFYVKICGLEFNVIWSHKKKVSRSRLGSLRVLTVHHLHRPPWRSKFRTRLLPDESVTSTLSFNLWHLRSHWLHQTTTPLTQHSKRSSSSSVYEGNGCLPIVQALDKWFCIPQFLTFKHRETFRTDGLLFGSETSDWIWVIGSR